MKNGVPAHSAPVRYDSFVEELPPPPEDEYPEPADSGEDWEAPPAPPVSAPVSAPPPEEQAVETPAAPPEEAPVEETGAEPSVSWAEIVREAAPLLPKDISTRLDDEKSVRGHIEGPLLRLEVLPGFLYARFNRQDILAKFSDAASGLAGREIRAALSELSDKPAQPSRSLDELRAFKEVRFI